MSRFTMVSSAIWTKRKVRGLTDAGRTLLLYFLTCETAMPIPGVVLGGPAKHAEALERSAAWFEKALKELITAGVKLRFDRQARLIWIESAVTKYQPPKSAAQVLAWSRAWDQIPDCATKLELWKALEVACRHLVGTTINQRGGVLDQFDQLFARPSAVGARAEVDGGVQPPPASRSGGARTVLGSGEGTAGALLGSGEETAGAVLHSGDGTAGAVHHSGEGTAGAVLDSGEGTAGPGLGTGEGTAEGGARTVFVSGGDGCSHQHHNQQHQQQQEPNHCALVGAPARERPSPSRRLRTGDGDPRQAYRQVLDAFAARYTVQNGTKPTVNAKLGGQIKHLLQQHEAGEITRRIDVLFDGHGPSFLRPPYDFGTVVQHFDKLVKPTIATTGAAPPRRDHATGTGLEPFDG